MNDQWTLATHYYPSTAANAETLVLLHSLGSSHSMWDECLGELVEHFHVLTLDLPGHGGSRPAPITGKLTADLLLDAIERTLNTAGVDRFHFAGLSIGAMMTCAAAQRWGNTENGRLLSATAMASGPANGTPDMWVDRAELILSQGTAALVDATMDRWFSPKYATAFPDAVERIRQAFLSCDDEGYAQCCEILETTDLRMGMHTIRVPFAIVNGSEDGGFSDQPASALAATLVNAPWTGVTHIEGARHMCAMENPHAAVTAILHAARAANS